MGRAMFTIIGAMAELESSLISERVTAGMKAAKARGRHLGRPPIARRIVSEIEALAPSTDLSIRQIQKEIAGRASRGVVGEITKRIRATPAPALWPLFTRILNLPPTRRSIPRVTDGRAGTRRWDPCLGHLPQTKPSHGQRKPALAQKPQQHQIQHRSPFDSWTDRPHDGREYHESRFCAACR
jgi:hypothetical protein